MLHVSKMKTNSDLQKDVQNAINWESNINATKIGVTAKDGIITLSGTVDSYSKKLHVERVVKNVAGVKAVVEDITIDLGGFLYKTDTNLANDILKAWSYDIEVPDDKIKVTVENGWVKLEGEVPWKYQAEASKNTIKNLLGVKGVTNLITVKSESQDSLEQKDVVRALDRNWAINAKDITVKVNKNRVELSGLVHSLYQKEEAERLAWNTPGVWSVKNNLAVGDLLITF